MMSALDDETWGKNRRIDHSIPKLSYVLLWDKN